MEFVLEVIFQFLGEILIQIIAEILAELGFRSLSSTFKRPSNPVLSAIGFILLGAIAGGVSLLIFPTSPISNPDLRKINLFVTPTIAGIVMMTIGKIRDKKGQDLVRLDRFGYAFAFAFSMGLVRFIWAA